jgi:hypothetical protein
MLWSFKKIAYRPKPIKPFKAKGKKLYGLFWALADFFQAQ